MTQATGVSARGRALACALVPLLAAVVAGCASTPEPRESSRAPGLLSPREAARPQASGRTHRVKHGETLWRISKTYGVQPEALARANALRDPRELHAGQLLVIPPAAPAPDGAGPRLASPSPAVWGGVRSRGRVRPADAFQWPVRGRLSSGFGLRDGAHHAGLDILAPTGTKVRAAESGRVVHSDRKLEGYGNMIILKHSGRFSTVYAHNHRNLVRVGDFVEKGQVIAEVGQTGRASAPHLHFELRRDGSPIDPLDYLP
jgi:murein DD-endopeptidase MepM/ murein hydrolase activator NlpD